MHKLSWTKTIFTAWAAIQLAAQAVLAQADGPAMANHCYFAAGGHEVCRGAGVPV